MPHFIKLKGIIKNQEKLAKHQLDIRLIKIFRLSGRIHGIKIPANGINPVFIDYLVGFNYIAF